MPERRHLWLPVARWEFVRTVKRVDFVASVLAAPVAMLALGLLLGGSGNHKPVTIAVARVDAAGIPTARAGDALSALRGFRWVDPGSAAGDTALLTDAVRARTYDAALVLRPDRGSGPPIADLILRRGAPRWTGTLQAFLNRQLRHDRASALGLRPAGISSLEDTVAFRRHVALGSQSAGSRAEMLFTLALLILFVTVIVVSNSYMMAGISGEKTARVTEVVISAISAEAWMDGKIIALSGAGLLVGVVWSAALIVMAGPLAFVLPGTINLGNLIIALAFVILGLYLYNALIAGLMASAQNLQSAMKWQANFVVLPCIPLLFLRGLIENPDAPSTIVLSIVPFFSPAMIPTRLALGAVRPWEIAVAGALLLGACVLMRIAAGRIFRLGMLMYGKDMTMPELVRWARTR
jgi:ABC-2 type transport system permease protein